MMGFLWNSLRVGERVRVHDGTSLVNAEVAFIDVLRGANGLGLRVARPEGGSQVLWPSRLAVHAEVGAVEDRCLRCAAPAVGSRA